MRILILSDIHANDTALSAVLEHAERTYDIAFNTVLDQEVVASDRIIFLGDMLGYGPDAVDVLKKAEKFNAFVVGNHDVFYLELINLLENLGEQTILTNNHEEVAISQILTDILDELRKGDSTLTWDSIKNLSGIAEYVKETGHLSVNNDFGFEAMLRNIVQIKAQDYDEDWYFKDIKLEKIPEPKSVKLNGYHFILVHGSLADSIGSGGYIYPGDDFLIQHSQIEEVKRKYRDSSICLCSGHSHIPLFVSVDDRQFDMNEIDTYKMVYEEPMKLGKWLTLINPGSVGFPRDCDPRAAYALLDTEKKEVTFWRVKYDIDSTISRMNSLHFHKELQEWLRTAEFPKTLNDVCKRKLANRIKDNKIERGSSHGISTS